MARAKTPYYVNLPCCNKCAVITQRRSRMEERPRQHVCPDCKKQFLVDLRERGKAKVRPL